MTENIEFIAVTPLDNRAPFAIRRECVTELNSTWGDQPAKIFCVTFGAKVHTGVPVSNEEYARLHKLLVGDDPPTILSSALAPVQLKKVESEGTHEGEEG